MKTEGLVRWRQRALARACLMSGLGLLLAIGVSRAEAITITQFPASVHETGGMARTLNGNVWVATANGLTRMAPDGTVTGTFTTSVPSNLTLGPDGALWFSGPASAGTGTTSLGRLTTAGSYTEHPIATPAATIGGLAAGSDGNLWFSQSLNGVHRIARLALATGFVTEFQGPTVAPGAMALGPDGNVWFAEGEGQVGRVTPAGLVTEMPLHGAASALAFAPGSAAGFYVSSGLVGRITPAAGVGNAATAVFRQGLSPFPDIQGIAVGADGNGWFTDGINSRVGRIKPSGQIDEFMTGIALRGIPHAIIAGPGPTVWFSDTNNQRIGRIVLDGPQALTGEASALSTSGATLSAVVLPRGAVTSAYFEWGTTTAYGAVTPAHDVGDGEASTLMAAPVAGLAPATTYHYRVVATSPVGTAIGADRTLATSPVPQLPVTTVDVPPDSDGDGYPDAVDCGPGNAAIHPGATEIPGNAADENCDGGVEPYQRFFPRTDVTFDNHGRRFSVFTRMTLSDVPAGAAFRLSCKGRGCGFPTWSSGSVKREAKRMSLLRHLRRSRLRPGATLELRMTRPGQIATVVRWTVGPPPRPAVTCLYPGTKKEQKCPR